MKSVSKTTVKSNSIHKHEPLIDEVQIANAKQRFGNRVMLAREEKKLTRIELASMIGKSMQHVRLIENGDRFPAMDVFYNICNALQVSPVYFMFDYLTIEVPDHYERLYKLLDTSPPRQAAIIVDILDLAAKRMETDS